MVLILLFDIFLEGSDDVVFGEPTVASSDFQLDKIVDGLSRPTGLTFLGPGEFIVIEEDTGMVKRITNGKISQTILDLDVSTDDSREV
jgi:glucose/arabinose dehydrogenase